MSRIPLPPPLGLGADALTSLALRTSPLIALTSAGAGLWGLLRLRLSAGSSWWALIGQALRGPVLWVASALLHLHCARWSSRRSSAARALFCQLVDPALVEAARASRPEVPFAATIHPSLFPFSRFQIQRVGVPGGDSMDVWPSFGTGLESPVFVFLHGGAWKGGSSRFNPSVLLLHRLSACGWRVFAVNYRKQRWPQHLNDCKAALECVMQEIGRTRLLVLGGGSAGGHLAALLAGADGLPGGGARPLDAVVLMSPALDPADDLKQFLPFPCGGPSSMRWFFERVVLRGHQEYWPEASPMAKLHASFPPCLLVHGAHDGLTPLAASRAFMASLASARHCPRDALVEVPGSKHAFEHGGGALAAAVLDGIVAWLAPLEGHRAQ